MKKTHITFLLMIVASWSCKHKPFVVPGPYIPTPVDTGLCFDRDILPIFTSQCAKAGCHDATSHEENYVLDNYVNIVSRGIAPGNASGSKIYKVLLTQPEDRMPKDAPPLTDAQILTIKLWIDAGAKKDTNCAALCDTNNFAFNSAVRPLINKYCTGCHSGGTPSGSLVLTTYDDVRNAVLNRNLLQSIRQEPGYPAMPKGGTPLSACQVRQIEKWVETNMPNN